MEDHREPLGMPREGGTPDVDQALDAASAFLRQLIALPGSQSVGPLPPLPASARGGATESDPARSEVDDVGAAAASIVEQAASVLDEEMARGVLAARSGAGTAPRRSSGSSNPVLRQMHELVDNLAALWPSLQGGAREGASTYRPSTLDAETPVTVRPRATVRPGERAVVSMTLRNSESQAVRLAPAATDLLGSRGGRIPSALFEFGASEIVLEPQEQKDLTMSIPVPAEAAPGRYSGLLVVRGLDYLRALVAVEVSGTAVTATGTRYPTPPRDAVTRGGTPSATDSVGVPRTRDRRFDARSRGHETGPDPPSRSSRALPVTRSGSMTEEAGKLAEDGELGRSDAIRLLQIPHRPDEVKEVLAEFEQELTREARSMLTLEAFAPLPDGVDNQRYEPIFDRYPITGKTYTTASGTVVLNEIQYYNGEMVQLFGECPDVAGVREDLAGSGYKPLTMRQADGRECAIAQFWAHELTDTSLRPYNASFVVVVVVPDDTPADRACFAADENGVSSVLSMYDGAFDQAGGVYENRARLFFVRLLDSTRIAIEVGRERMGTDKRPGTIRLTRESERRSISVEDGAGSSVAEIDFIVADDPGACLRDLARAAATAGMPSRAFPAGTEYVYPSVARIGAGPVVNWQWHTDLLPRLQRAGPDTVAFDSSSEEGETLIRWGFEPKLLGYIPNVRGVVTGLS